MYLRYLQVLVLSAYVILSMGWDYEIQRIDEVIPDDPIWDIHNLKVIRVQRGLYALDGDLILKVDLDQSFTFEVRAFYNPTGGSYYQQTPLRLPPDPFCNFLNNGYKKFFMTDLTKVSNFPLIEDDTYCPLPAQTYNVDHYQFDNSVLPDLKSGFYKMVFLFNSTTDGRRSQWDIYLKITD